MKSLMVLGLASVMVAAAPADARQGCGTGFHRAPNGRCVPNLRARQAWVVGRYYDGRGYWYNNRWWHNRYRYHDQWRYR